MASSLEDVEIEEINDNVGRDCNENHQSSVNVIKVLNDEMFMTGSSDNVIKVWRIPKMEDDLKDKNRFYNNA
jgi:hypothetical protein